MTPEWTLVVCPDCGEHELTAGTLRMRCPGCGCYFSRDDERPEYKYGHRILVVPRLVKEKPISVLGDDVYYDRREDCIRWNGRTFWGERGLYLLAIDRAKYGAAYIGPDGKRIDPTKIKVAPSSEPKTAA